MTSYKEVDDSESTTTASLTPAGLLTPATEPEQDAQTGLWFKISRAILDDSTHDPSPGEALIILDQTYGRVLACHPGGHLILDNINEYSMDQPVPERWKWRCTDKDHFIGFRNLATNRFLGHNIRWNFVVEAAAQQEWEYFVLMKRHDGYRIQSPNWCRFKLLSARPDGAGVGVERPGGTSWGFVLVGT